MKIVTLLALFWMFACNADDLEQLEFQYNSGSTMVSLYGYHVKFTAEQRTSDNLVQVLVLPQEQGVQFTIEDVSFSDVPPGSNVSGPVANVQGVFSVVYNTEAPMRVVKTVPVQISTVDAFTVSSDEADVEGIQQFQKQLPLQNP